MFFCGLRKRWCQLVDTELIDLARQVSKELIGGKDLLPAGLRSLFWNRRYGGRLRLYLGLLGFGFWRIRLRRKNQLVFLIEF